ncbi:potassium channel family protein [Microbulbifer sp. TRSA001]|uniref:potassium channel family protein n=1 Tax=Microbulbifer sp. TRSA001 TaxID=3243381 RepID=UPI004039D072
MKINLTPKSIGIFYLSLVPIFGIIYWLADSLWKTPLGLVESIYFSVVTITTLGYGDISPITDAGRILTGTQALLGIVSIGLFLNSVSERRAELQEKKRHDAVVEHLLWQYQNFRESVTEICLRGIAGGYNTDWKLKLHLPEMLKFREYFSENNSEKWYIVLNALQSDDGLLQDLLVEIDMFSEQVTFALNNTSANDHEVLRFLTRFSQHPHRLNNLDVYSGDKVKYIGGFIYEIMAGWSVIDGYRDNDLFLEKFKKL